MLGRNRSEPALFQMVDLEVLVPPDHRLRKIDRVLDLSFVRESVAECYSAGRGRPSVDPELVIRMLLLGALYGLGDRELCEEVHLHVGFRWFCRLNLHDEVPDHSTLSKLKNERWAESGLFARLFDEVLRQCAEAGLVSGRHVSIDGTQIEANASMKSLSPLEPEPDITPEKEGPPEGLPVQEPQPAGAWSGHGVKYSNQTHRSTSDPDARLYRKGNAREAKLSYLMHDLLDTKSRVVLRRRVSLAHSSAEREVALEMLDDLMEAAPALGLPHAVGIVSADTGYGTGEFVADVLDRGVLPHVPLQAAPAPEEVPTWKRRTFHLERQRQRREKVRRAQARNRVRALQQSRGYAVSRKLRIRSEHCFAEAKTLHGMDRARLRGLTRVQVQADLVGTAQNLKRLVAFRGRPQGRAARLGLSAPAAPLHRACRSVPGRLFRLTSLRRSRRLARPRLHRPLPRLW